MKSLNKRELVELALDIGLSFNEASSILYGVRRDYPFYLALIGEEQFGIFFSLRAAEGHVKPEIFEALTRISDVLPAYETAGFCVAYQVAAGPDRSHLPYLLEDAIEDSTRYFEKQGLLNACEKSGRTGQIELYQVDGELLFLAPASYVRLMAEQRIEPSKIKLLDPQKENYFLELVRAFLLVLIGATILFLFVASGRFIGYLALASGLVTSRGYKFFAKKFSVFGFVISFFFALVMSFLAFQLGYANAYYQGDRPLLAAFAAINQAALAGQLDFNYWLSGLLGLLGCLLGTSIGSGLLEKIGIISTNNTKSK